MTGDVARFDEVIASLRLPAVAAPMTFISTPELVAAACAAGIIGSFPTSNASSVAELDEWFDQIESRRARAERTPGPIAANLIVGKQNTRLDDDVDCVVRHRPAMVITSVGSPAPVIPALQVAGCLVFADVASEAHAHKALEAGADGLVLLSAGAGGHTGWANPFAFVRAVRAFFAGPLVLTGGMSDGASLWAAQCAGFDLAMFGTRFIATDESAAPSAWRDALVAGTMDDISLATAPNGVVASVLGDNAGSAGHTVSAVHGQQSVAALVDEIETGWHQAQADTRQLLDLEPQL
ncbi:NAD(P)H-dependent flavin oxidoreductase [Ilumatobacter sp.]|uniref:NAD(P)H-dependent flavin oxidoreductase n=1 Tax=Ilumatobacter sp. TaxID=1967498 RepID=UPI003C496951